MDWDWYRGLSEEEKRWKREYAKDWHWNMWRKQTKICKTMQKKYAKQCKKNMSEEDKQTLKISLNNNWKNPEKISLTMCWRKWKKKMS